jgi:hypothetical protein
MSWHTREELNRSRFDSPALPLYDGRSTLPVIDRAFVAGDRPVALLIPCPIIWVSHDADDQART